MSKYDCIVVGYGPCGISTAIYLKRYGYNPLVIGKDNGALDKAHLIENYYGLEPISGPELIQKGIKQAQDLGIDIIYDEVVSIEYADGFDVVCVNNRYNSKTVMIAVGTNRSKFPLASKFEGNGVSFCATCDGFFYRKKPTAIVGSGVYMLHELEVLKSMIPNLTLFTNGEELSVTVEDINIVKDKIVSFNGSDKLESITTVNETYNIEGCFIATGSLSGFSLAKHMGIEINGNNIVVDTNMMTNIPGIFAGGDCIGGLLQVSKAVSDGAIAATAISKYLKSNK